MDSAFHTTRRVEFRDTDAAGIMHFSNFFLMMEEAEHELLRSIGLGVVFHDPEGKISWPRIAAQCAYQSPVQFEDVLDIRVVVERLGEKSVTYGFTFTCQDRPVAQGQMTAVCCRFAPNAPPQPIAIPPKIAEKLAAFKAS